MLSLVGGARATVTRHIAEPPAYSLTRYVEPIMFKDITGQRFGRLIAIRYIGQHLSPKGKPEGSRWLCQCDCGESIETQSATLLRGSAKSCGCFHREQTRLVNLKHGKSATAQYKHWHSIVNRCTQPGSINWKNYGGRGITICDRWRHGENGKTGFECFVADMGDKPLKLDIDRINNDGNYEPGNCRWVTRSQNLQNKRKTTTCPEGHPRDGNRNCTICKRAYDRQRYLARKGNHGESV